MRQCGQTNKYVIGCRLLQTCENKTECCAFQIIKMVFDNEDANNKILYFNTLHSKQPIKIIYGNEFCKTCSNNKHLKKKIRIIKQCSLRKNNGKRHVCDNQNDHT